MPDSRKTKNRRLSDLVYSQLFQLVPFNIAVIDRNYNIIKANKNFEEYFGKWKGKKCYKVYKKINHPCEDCNSLLTFEDGKTRVVDGVGVDKDGRQAHYIVHIAPLKSSKGKQIDYIVEMSSDITETKRWQKEYQVLFDRVPCYITVIDKNYKIIRANESFRENFGDVIGQQCYSVYKHRKRKCPNCPAAKTFKDGQIHHSNQVGIKKAGEETHYVVATSPLGRGEEEVAHVIEISTDTKYRPILPQRKSWKVR